MDEFLPFINIDWTLVFMLINTFILFLLVRRFLIKPVQNIFEKRKAELDKLYSDAEKLVEDARMDKEKYAQILSNADEEASATLQMAAKKAAARSEEILAEANNQARALADRTASQLELDKRKALAEIKDEISQIAVMLATKAISKELDAAEQERLFKELINEIH